MLLTTMTNSNPNVQYTVKELLHDIKQRQEEMHLVQHEIREQVTRTNGRVTVLEKASIGLWIQNNPIRFALTMTVIVVAVSDLRHPIISFVLSLL